MVRDSSEMQDVELGLTVAGPGICGEGRDLNSSNAMSTAERHDDFHDGDER